MSFDRKKISDTIFEKSINFTITNKSSKKINIFKKINTFDYQIVDLEYYNQNENRFNKIAIPSKDIQYLPDFKNDFIKLRNNKKYTYEIKIEDITNQIGLKNQKIRFKLSFQAIGLGGCNFITDYLYYN